MDTATPSIQKHKQEGTQLTTARARTHSDSHVRVTQDQKGKWYTDSSHWYASLQRLISKWSADCEDTVAVKRYSVADLEQDPYGLYLHCHQSFFSSSTNATKSSGISLDLLVDCFLLKILLLSSCN